MTEHDGPSTASLGGSSERTISEVARQFGISSKTLRSYEDKELLNPRHEGKVRFYDKGDLDRLGLIIRFKRLGFALDDIRQFVVTRRRGEKSVTQSSAIEQVARMARETFGTDEKAQRWLVRPTTALFGLSPLDVSSAGESGVRKVVDLLKRIDHGLSV